MRESDLCFHNVEWPPEGASLAGPIAWLRGWIVGKPGFDFVDVRVRHAGGIHLGILGLPRTDLAVHFGSSRPWLPAEFIVGVPVADGPVILTIEAADIAGAWHPLQSTSLEIRPDGATPPRIEGRLETSPEGTWTARDPHHPFHGHLDQPSPTPARTLGRITISGWLLDERGPLREVMATTDAMVFNHLNHSRHDPALAAKVAHAGAGRARLSGLVDYPDTAVEPACLRVYAVTAGGEVHLCFARRIHAAHKGERAAQRPIHLAPLDAPPLPTLPSGRPRRLLVVVRSLLPNDSTLRALDVVRHLVPAARWAARLVTAEDGPLRRDFEAAGVESLVVDPLPLMAASDEPEMTAALRALEREIWWTHLDAVAVFDPVCAWAGLLARRQGIPVVFDCGDPEPLAPDAAASPTVRALLEESWRAASVICFSSHVAARAQAGWSGQIPAEILLPWHTPGLPAAVRENSREIQMPLRPGNWLMRSHGAVAAPWSFKQGPAGETIADHLAQLDEAFNLPILKRSPNWSVEGCAFCAGPLFGRGPLRPIIDAVAAGIPAVAPRMAITEEIFHGTRVPLVSPANPLAVAHAFLAWSALPESWQRAAAEAAPDFQVRHDPARLIPAWERLLAAAVARGG